MRPSAGVTAAIAWISGAAGAAAQDVRLSVPLEYASGFADGATTPRPFAGGLRTGLLLRLGARGLALAGPAGGLLYDGEWTPAGGARVGVRVPHLGAADAGVYVFAEALRGRDRTPLSLSLVADLPVRPALYARFGVSLTRDVSRDRDEVALVVGVDVARWAADLFGDDGPRTVQP